MLVSVLLKLHAENDTSRVTKATRMDVTQPSTEPNYRILPAYRYGGSTGDEEDDPSMVTSDHESGTRRSKTSEDAEVENGSNWDSEGCSKKIARSSICPSRLNRHCFSNVSLCMSASEHGPLQRYRKCTQGPDMISVSVPYLTLGPGRALMRPVVMVLRCP